MEVKGTENGEMAVGYGVTVPAMGCGVTGTVGGLDLGGGGVVNHNLEWRRRWNQCWNDD